MTTFIFVAAFAALVLAVPVSAQNACLLQGQYFFSVVVNTPAAVHGIGTLEFTPPGPQGSQACIGAVPGTVAVTSDLVTVTTPYFVNGVVVTIPFSGGATIGFLGLVEGGVAKGFVYSGTAGGGLSFSRTSLRSQ